jgi:hypothetical protein
MVGPVGPNPPANILQPPTTSQSLNITSSSLSSIEFQSTLASLSAGFPELAQYYGDLSASLRAQLVQELISAFQDASKRAEMYAASASSAASLGDLINLIASYNNIVEQLKALKLDQSIQTVNNAITVYNNDIDNSKATDLNNAYNAYVSDPSSENADAYQEAVTNYNNYLHTLNTDIDSINTAVNNWNATNSSAVDLITQANDIRTKLGLDPLNAPTNLSTLSHYSDYVIGQNTTVSTLSSLPTYTWVNPPPLDENDYQFQNKILTIGAVFINLNRQSDEDFDSLFDPIDKYLLRTSPANLQGGSGASNNMTTVSFVASANNPFLASDLSQQGLNAYFNQYGVPLGSSLVDQIGALISNFNTNVNPLLSASDAQEILNNGTITVDGGLLSVRAAVALGNLSVLSSTSQQDALVTALRNLLTTSPEFNALSADQQVAFLTGLANELIGIQLIKGLQELGTLIGIPGLVPQLLAHISGLTTNAALGNFLAQLYYTTTLSQLLPSLLGISQQQADAIAVAVLQNAQQNQSEITQQSIIDAIVQQIGQGAIDQATLNQKAAQADAIASQAVSDQVAAQDQAQRSAYQDSVASSLQQGNLATELQTQTLIQQLQVATSQQFDEITLTALRNFSLSQEQINEIVRQANVESALRGAISDNLVSLSDIQAAFQTATTNVLKPVVGQTQAEEVSNQYAQLIFQPSEYSNQVTSTQNVHRFNIDSPDTILNRLSVTAEDVVTEDGSNQPARIFEQYRSASTALQDPLNAPSSPLKTGETLVLAGMASGPATMGILGTDKPLDPEGKQYKTPVDIPI